MFRFFGSLSITDLTQPWIFPFWNDQYLFVKLLIENNSTKQTNVIKSYNVECISPKCKKVEVVKINVTDNDEAYIAHPSGKRLLLAKQVHERFSSKDFLQTDLVLAKGDKYIQYICLKVNNLPLPSVIQITIQDIHNHLYKAKIKIPKRYRFRFAYIQRYE